MVGGGAGLAGGAWESGGKSGWFVGRRSARGLPGGCIRGDLGMRNYSRLRRCSSGSTAPRRHNLQP